MPHSSFPSVGTVFMKRTHLLYHFGELVFARCGMSVMYLHCALPEGRWGSLGHIIGLRCADKWPHTRTPRNKQTKHVFLKWLSFWESLTGANGSGFFWRKKKAKLQDQTPCLKLIFSKYLGFIWSLGESASTLRSFFEALALFLMFNLKFDSPNTKIWKIAKSQHHKPIASVAVPRPQPWCHII